MEDIIVHIFFVYRRRSLVHVGECSPIITMPLLRIPTHGTSRVSQRQRSFLEKGREQK